MSIISQFFPSGSGGGGGTPGIPLEMLLVSGGGGYGYAADSQGNWAGGGGAIEVVRGYPVQPGTTLAITVGQGGLNAGPSYPGCAGVTGGTSSVVDPTGERFQVLGGGGGGVGAPSPGPRAALSGGTGGAGGGGPTVAPITAAEGVYYEGNVTASNMEGLNGFLQLNKKMIVGPTSFQYSYELKPSGYLQTRYGFKGGFPGMYCSTPSPSIVSYAGGAGGMIAGYFLPYPVDPAIGGAPFGQPVLCTPAFNGFYSNIEGTRKIYGLGGSGATCPTIAEFPCCFCRDTCCPNQGWGGGGGCKGVNNTTGQPGVVIIKYPDAFAAASPTAYPGATDISPSTPGYRTYRFTSTGTLTLP